MHGIILAKLKKYVDARFGPGRWGTLLEDAGRYGERIAILESDCMLKGGTSCVISVRRVG